MFNGVQLTKKYLHYWVKSSNAKGHGIHSPFVYNLVRKVLNDSREYPEYDVIESLRNQFKKDRRVLHIQDYGARCESNAQYTKSVSLIESTSVKNRKYSQLLYRIAKYFQPRNILELGTSLGITTAYLSSAVPHAKIITIEGSPEVADTAQENFKKLGLDSIEVITGNFDHKLAGALQQLKKADMVFVDGNHRYEPTMRYFKQILPYTHKDSVLIFDDIHWSEEMEQAWEHIRKDDAVTLSIDLFFIGLVFFRKENKIKQHFSIRF